MYYTLHAFLTIIIIIINIIIIIIIIITIIIIIVVCWCYISTQESSNHKACADWPILRSTRRSDYLITGRARGTREGGEEASSPFLSSCVLDISSFAPTKKL